MLLIAMTSFEYEADGSHPTMTLVYVSYVKVVVGAPGDDDGGAVLVPWHAARTSTNVEAAAISRIVWFLRIDVSLLVLPVHVERAGRLGADPYRRVREVRERDLFQFYDFHVLRGRARSDRALACFTPFFS